MNSFSFEEMQLNFINLGNKLNCTKNIRMGLLKVFPRETVFLKAYLESQLAYTFSPFTFFFLSFFFKINLEH